ncbi:MarR family winged helix-turn-helix transcriptional regulator [Rhodobium gokarnense]|uniref:DNA-binding MarR family transcriptional regulator n=1 Tax=Rhodobium gokarnense TaxID=364296 RepID=A0ABT3HFV4_9HYPH|nr:MarR family transcriptional regulator [Rhodobium gokarnense]MCW2309264.1 DNA-binding MarR family transcriptional regulator [Rhodobium gokarnense]
MEKSSAALLFGRLEAHWPETATAEHASVVLCQRVARLLDESARRALAPHGLGFTEFEVLAALRSAPAPHDMIPSELYEAVLISSGGLTKVMKGLEARGLIERPTCAANDDRRRRPIRLTAAGQALVEKAIAVLLDAYHRRLAQAGFTKAELSAGNAFLGRLLSGLEAADRD